MNVRPRTKPWDTADLILRKENDLLASALKIILKKSVVYCRNNHDCVWSAGKGT